MYKHLSELLSLVEINLKVRYRQTFVGFLWVISNPILLFSVQAILFSFILQKFSSDYYLYLFTGLLPWFFISQTVEMGCTYLSSNAGLLKNVKIHPYKLIWSLVVENYINLIFYSSIIFLYLYFNFNTQLSFFFFYMLTSLWLIFITTHLTFIASLLNVLFKDTRYIFHFLFTILYFLTPSFYYLENLPENVRFFVMYNPFYWIVSLFRITPGFENVLNILLVNVCLTLILVFISTVFWKKSKSLIYLKL